MSGNSGYPDDTAHSAASHLDIHCLLMPVCPHTHGIMGINETFGHFSGPPRGFGE